MDANLICVVDDEASIIDFVSLYLKREGFSVIGYLYGGIEKGVGLGLSIAQQIVFAHGGEITVTSELGKGSCFMVKIPIAHER